MKGFYFKTKNGNTYFYNDSDGSVSLVMNKEEPLTHANNLFTQEFKTTRIEIENFLKTNGYEQITLIVTEDCNLRCKYCAYSGNYENMRTHRKSYMTPEVAKEAVKKYFEGFIPVKEKNPYRLPVIGFYGGEPLLNFNLIREVVDFAESIYPGRIFFTVTTNGTLLNSDMVDFFYKHNFSLAISLNGPKREHDRLRIFPNGEGTFDIVWRNLQKIRKRYPEYFRKMCSILSDYDAGTNLIEFKNFFELYEYALPALIVFFPISQYFTHWHKQYSDKQRSKFKQSLKLIKEEYFRKLINGENISIFLDSFLGFGYRMLMNRPQNVLVRPYFLPYTGTCVPGNKIGVSPDGKFHCCEKINDKFPIGDVEKGLDFEKITNMISIYCKQIYPECYECPITRLCPICYATTADNGKFVRSPSNICVSTKQDMKIEFEELWSLLEEGVEESMFLKNKDGLPFSYK